MFIRACTCSRNSNEQRKKKTIFKLSVQRWKLNVDNTVRNEFQELDNKTRRNLYILAGNSYIVTFPNKFGEMLGHLMKHQMKQPLWMMVRVEWSCVSDGPSSSIVAISPSGILPKSRRSLRTRERTDRRGQERRGVRASGLLRFQQIVNIAKPACARDRLGRGIS